MLFRCPLKSCNKTECLYYKIQKWKRHGNVLEYKKLYKNLLDCLGEITNYFAEHKTNTNSNIQPSYYPKVAAVSFILRWSLDPSLVSYQMIEKMASCKKEIMNEIKYISPSFKSILNKLL